ncbi:MAG: hypothetical protein HY043_18590, partial [Verrucomicrobia bacterium]|nr:hypothetical protein [Verrucomicrobiota bacterium]
MIQSTIRATVLAGCVAACLLRASSADGRIITVTTTNNVSPATQETSLLQALSKLADGDTIQFAIPGTGPYFIPTPTNGYPLITNNNITIDGYSQPGASPNTNSILAPNNARLQIVLDSRSGAGTSMDYAPAN